MRKATAVVLAAALLFAAAPVALADDGMTNYELAGLSMRLDLPDGWLAVTRDNEPGNETLKAMGLGRDYQSALTDNDIWLQAACPDEQIMFTVTAPPDAALGALDIYQLSDMDEQELADFRDNYMVTFGGADSGIAFRDFYTANGVTYYILDAVTGGGSVAQQYNTVVNGHMVVLTIGTTGGSNASLEDVMRQIVDSARFELVSKEAAQVSEADKAEMPDEPVPAGLAEKTNAPANESADIGAVQTSAESDAGMQGAPMITIVIIAAAALALGALAVWMVRRSRRKVRG